MNPNDRQVRVVAHVKTNSHVPKKKLPGCSEYSAMTWLNFSIDSLLVQRLVNDLAKGVEALSQLIQLTLA